MPGLTPIDGTLVNCATVICGGGLGLAFSGRLPETFRRTVFTGLGLATLAIGLSMALKMQNPLIVIFATCLGGIMGAALAMDARLNGLGERLKRLARSKNDRFTEGLVTAFLLFCVGSLTILGAFDEGLRGDATLLYTKSVLDGFAALALASTFGMGVVASVVPLFAYQTTLTLFAGSLAPFVSPAMLAELTATGGLLIVGIGLNLLDLKKIPLADFLPALALAPLLSALAAAFA